MAPKKSAIFTLGRVVKPLLGRLIMKLDPRLHAYELANLGFLEDEDIVLDFAALQIARLDHPRQSFGTLIDLLAGMAAELAGIVTPKHAAARQAIALKGAFARRGFRGMPEPHIRSADMFRALASRQGAPLSLAILYIATARRAGLTAVLLDTTTTVFIRLGCDEDEAVFAVDAAGDLRPVSPAEGGRDRRAWPDPITNRMILVRLLETEASTVEMQGDFERALVLRNRVCVIAPMTSEGWINNALINERTGRPLDAKMCLVCALENTRDPFLRNRIIYKLTNKNDRGIY